MPGYLKFLEKVASPVLGNGCSENFKKSGKSYPNAFFRSRQTLFKLFSLKSLVISGKKLHHRYLIGF